MVARWTSSGEAVPTGNVQRYGRPTSTALELGNGTVRVTVVCQEQEYTAGVSDTAAVVENSADAGAAPKRSSGRKHRNSE